MSLKPLKFFFLIAAVQLCRCSYPADSQSISISKASLFSSKSAKETNSIAFIYDYNTDRLKLEWTACKIVASSGDQLVDAIKAFISKNKEKGICQSMELQKIDKSKKNRLISFLGKPVFKNKKDRKIFLTALEMTINRNSEQGEFDIRFL